MSTKTVWIAASAIVLAICVAPFAIAAGENTPVKGGARNPSDNASQAYTKETQIIAIYGKGGIGKSFTLANLSYMMAQQGKRVLLIGCDPKSDTTSLLFGGKSTPTIIETSSRKSSGRKTGK